MNTEADKLAEALRKIDRLCAAETDMPFTQIAAIRAANKEACAILSAYDPVWSAVHRGMEHALHSAPRMAVTEAWHFGPSPNLDHVRIYPDGAIFNEAATIAQFPVLPDGTTQDICARICAAHNVALESFAASHSGDEQQARNAARWLSIRHIKNFDAEMMKPAEWDRFADERIAKRAAIEQQKERAQRASFDPLQDEPK